MEKLYQYLPEELVTFILVTVFSLLIGLSLRRISLKREGETTLFGTDRTFTFIGILGYLLYILDPVDYRLFMGGGAVLGVLLALNKPSSTCSGLPPLSLRSSRIALRLLSPRSPLGFM